MKEHTFDLKPVPHLHDFLPDALWMKDEGDNEVAVAVCRICGSMHLAKWRAKDPTL